MYVLFLIVYPQPAELASPARQNITNIVEYAIEQNSKPNLHEVYASPNKKYLTFRVFSN